MKTSLRFMCTILAIMMIATSCKNDDDPKPDDQPIDDGKEFQTVPYSFTINLSPMECDLQGVKLKTTFANGDDIEITNSQILYEPLVLKTDKFVGKTKATFSGELKIKKEISPSSNITLTAVLKNGSQYNSGKPFADVKKISSLTDEVDKYSYWSCENFDFNSESTTISLVQSTLFVEINLFGVQVTFKNGNAFNNELIKGDKFFAVPAGTKIEMADLKFEKNLNDENKIFYKFHSEAPNGCLPKLFSIGENQYVYFSTGNLQYGIKKGEWRLAPQQYHHCFEDFDEVGDDYEKWSDDGKYTDLFLPGQWIVGADPTKISSDNYTVTVDKNLELNTPCAYGEEWMVPSVDEWSYIMEKRTDAEQKRGGAIVDGVQGCVILPDDWTLPKGVSFEAVYSVDKDTDVPNQYTKDEWAKMESAGAVFLPYAGQLYSSMGFVMTFMTVYQSRTFTIDQEDGTYSAFAMFFEILSDDCRIYDSHFTLTFGNPIRLVQKQGANTIIHVE